MNENNQKEDMTVTNWWKSRESKYQILTPFVKLILSAMPSSVSSERLFKLSSFLQDDHQSSMNGDTFEMLIFIKGNMKLVMPNKGNDRKNWIQTAAKEIANDVPEDLENDKADKNNRK